MKAVTEDLAGVHELHFSRSNKLKRIYLIFNFHCDTATLLWPKIREDIEAISLRGNTIEALDGIIARCLIN